MLSYIAKYNTALRVLVQTGLKGAEFISYILFVVEDHAGRFYPGVCRKGRGGNTGFRVVSLTRNFLVPVFFPARYADSNFERDSLAP